MTASILRKFYLTSISSFDVSLCELFIGAFFFAMRSCEYVQVHGLRKTKLVTLQNIRFFKRKRVLIHSDNHLHKADCVSITFEFQKRDTKGDIITQHRSKDSLLCPVKIWAKIVKRLISNNNNNSLITMFNSARSALKSPTVLSVFLIGFRYPSSSGNTTVNLFLFQDGSSHLFSGKDLLSCIRLVAASIGWDELGFSPEDLGLHSARSGAAMAMFLAGVPVFTIMLLGCWSSDAFLRYIRKQVQEFSKGVSEKMISNERFFTISSDANSFVPSENRALLHNVGLNFKDTIRPLTGVFT
jgi:hypothetical protein